MKRLHIVGCARSGTTLMLKLISACFKNDSYCPKEMRIFEEPTTGGRLFFSKMPGDIVRIKPILEAHPNLCVIYMVRDPRDVISSHHGFIRTDEYFCDFQKWWKADDCAKALAGHERFVPVRYEDLVLEPDSVQAQLMQAFPFLEKVYDFLFTNNFSSPLSARWVRCEI